LFINILELFKNPNQLKADSFTGRFLQQKRSFLFLTLSMHVCKATIQDYEKNILKILSYFLIFGIFFSPKNGTVFWAKVELFVVLPKFDQINIFQKFKRNLVKEGLNQEKMAGDLEHLLAVNPCGLQTKKLNFHMFLWLGTNGKCLFGLSSTLACKICRGIFNSGKMKSIWKIPSRHMECTQLWLNISRLFFVILDRCFTNVHTQNWNLQQKMSPCLTFPDNDRIL
jgi:hypothetical protein